MYWEVCKSSEFDIKAQMVYLTFGHILTAELVIM